MIGLSSFVVDGMNYEQDRLPSTLTRNPELVWLTIIRGGDVAAGTRNNRNNHTVEVAQFSEVTSDWAAYKDSDIPVIPDSWQVTLLNAVTLVALLMSFAVVIVKVLILVGGSMPWEFGTGACSPMDPDSWQATIKVCALKALLAALANGPWVGWGLLLVSSVLLFLQYRRYKNPRTEIVTYGRNDKREVRYIWPGSGRVQFGCGTRGLSITNSAKFNYLLWWDKIDYIYFESDKRDVGFDELEPWGDDEKAVRVSENQDFFLLPEDRHSNAPDQGAIRVRLVDGNPRQSFVEEIVIPARFFGTSRESMSSKRFMESCWEFKWRHAHVWPVRYRSKEN